MATERDAPHPDGDEFRHVREVLAKRTPDSILTVNRYGMGINARATGKAATVLMRKQDDPNHAQADNDLDALSVLWNTADELLLAIDRERRRAAALRGALAEIKSLTDAASEATMTRSTLDLAWRVGRIAERHIPVTMEEADAPGVETITCPQCQGSGTVGRFSAVLGEVMIERCPRCGGRHVVERRADAPGLGGEGEGR